jgi:sensor domain CHASE-containing protein
LINLKPSHKDACRLEFSDSRDLKKRTKKNDRQNTDESNSSNEFREEAFIVVSKIKNHQNSPAGFRLGMAPLT